MDLIATLKAQHGEVQKLMESFEQSLSKNEGAKAKELITTIGGALVGHLALEDRELYPALVKLAEQKNDQHLAMVARTFMENMSRISGALIGFIDRHSNPNVGIDRLKAEWPAIRQTLGERIMSEESTLYPLYTRALKRAPAAQPAAPKTASKLGATSRYRGT